MIMRGVCGFLIYKNVKQFQFAGILLLFFFFFCEKSMGTILKFAINAKSIFAKCMPVKMYTSNMRKMLYICCENLISKLSLACQ